MPKQDNDRSIFDTQEERRQQMPQEGQSENNIQKSGKLLPFLNVKAQHHQNRLDDLESKVAAQQDKIDKHEIKIENLEAKALRLEDTNRLLKTMLGDFPVVQEMIRRNEEKITDIRENKIPTRKQKIEACEKKLMNFSLKYESVSHKLERVLALNDTIKSFSIIPSKQRREAFFDAMDRLNDAAYNCLSDKKKILNLKKDNIVEKYNSPETSAVEKYELQQQINDLNKRIQSINERIEKVWQPVEFYSMQDNETLDAQMKLTSDKIAEAAQEGNVNMPELAEDTLLSALETEELDKSKTAELADKFNDSVDGPEKSNNWLLDMVADGKAEINEDGAFRVNSEYYKELPRNERHVESMTEAQAVEVMAALSAADVAFSAASRGDDKVGITVSKKDIAKLNDIIYSAVGKIAKTDAVRENAGKGEKGKYQTINPEYYASLSKEQRHSRVEATEAAREIVKGLIAEKIPYSAVVRKNDTVAVTVSKDNAKAYKQIENKVKGVRAAEYINPEFYKALPKEFRVTLPMTEEQAKAKVAELDKKGIAHSAVINGERSAVTVSKKDQGRAFFSRSQLKNEVRRISGQGKKQPQKQKSPKKKDTQGLG